MSSAATSMPAMHASHGHRTQGSAYGVDEQRDCPTPRRWLSLDELHRSEHHIFPFHARFGGKLQHRFLEIVTTKNHHGRIECDSEPGAGTHFNIYFPVSKSVNVLKDEISTKKEKIATGNETILLIEDDGSILDALKRMLQHFGYTVITASYGEKAIEIYLAEQESIDLVILALNMPGMGGRKCLARLLEIKPELKTIVTSGYTSAANFKTVYDGGNAVFVEKPYQIEDLLRIIRQVLESQP